MSISTKLTGVARLCSLDCTSQVYCISARYTFRYTRIRYTRYRSYIQGYVHFVRNDDSLIVLDSVIIHVSNYISSRCQDTNNLCISVTYLFLKC